MGNMNHEERMEAIAKRRRAAGSDGSATCEDCGTPAAGHNFRQYGDTAADPLIRDAFLSNARHKDAVKFRRDASVGDKALCPSCWTTSYWANQGE